MLLQQVTHLEAVWERKLKVENEGGGREHHSRTILNKYNTYEQSWEQSWYRFATKSRWRCYSTAIIDTNTIFPYDQKGYTSGSCGLTSLYYVHRITQAPWIESDTTMNLELLGEQSEDSILASLQGLQSDLQVLYSTY